MTTENLLALWNCLELRQFVVDNAKSLSPKKKVQKDLVGHAWYVLGEATAQRTTDYYKRLCKMRMEKQALMILYKEVIIT